MSDPLDLIVGGRIKHRRIELKQTQSDLGRLAGGISFQQIQKYEAGINRVSASRLVHIARALGTDAEVFLRGLTNGNPA